MSVPDDVARDVYAMLPQLWGVNPSTYAHRIPCNHPCSLLRADLPRLHRKPHWVSPKVDGVRMFLLFSFVGDADYVVMVNRAGDMTCASVRAPLDAHSGTLLDGELVCHANGRRTLLVFDALSVNGYLLTDKPQSERVAMATKLVDSLHVLDAQLTVKMKRWFVLGRVDLASLASSVGNLATDGVILVPEHGNTLHPGRQRDHYKWKPEHTIDLMWREGKFWMERAGVPEPAEFVNRADLTTHDLPDHTVVEVRLHAVDGQWIATVVRLRPDKLSPNDVHVVNLTLQNITENIRLHELEEQ